MLKTSKNIEFIIRPKKGGVGVDDDGGDDDGNDSDHNDEYSLWGLG